MPQVEGLDILDYIDRLLVLPQLVLGCEGSLPEDTVERLTVYFVARLQQERPDNRVYSDPNNGIVEAYSVNPASPRCEQLSTRLVSSAMSQSPGRVYVSEESIGSSRNFLNNLREELSR